MHVFGVAWNGMATTMVEPIPDRESSAIRVLLANIPVSLERQLTQAIGNQENLQLVGQTRGYVEMLIAAQQDVDAVVLGGEQLHPPPGICSHLLAEYPDVKILLINPRGDEAYLYWMGLYQQDLHGATFDPDTQIDAEARQHQELSAPSIEEVVVKTLHQLDRLTQDPAARPTPSCRG